MQISKNDEANKIPIVLVANKIDDEKNRVVTKEQGEEIARQNNWEYIETSAKNNIKIADIFPKVVQVMLQRYKISELQPKNSLYAIDKNKDPKPIIHSEEEDAGGMGCC